MQNEEQVITALDNLPGRIIGYYGHIGLEYGVHLANFHHRGKMITTYHTDEETGKILGVEI